MHARALNDLLQLPLPKRFDAIADGLGLLTEHVEQLRSDLVHVAEDKRPRGTAVLSVMSEEEAAKILILLDVVRMDQTDHKALKRQVARFYQHLARCIYAEMAAMRPATFGEVVALVQSMRPSRYLDGPNDVDWIFRNQLLTRREEAVYVDYLRDEDGSHRWTTPGSLDTAHLMYSTSVQDLVGALDRVGCTSRGGLDIIAKVWAGKHLDRETHWQEAAALNREIVHALGEIGLARADATDEDRYWVIDRWLFPMWGIDVESLEVPISDLEAVRARHMP
jgi:hypothetical protein